jgi:WhiB family redox-sensing transcriptional regulator
VDTWRDDSICDRLSWEEKAYFFGDDPVMGTHKQHEIARTYCYQCPVQIECMKWCVEEDMFWGVWGGLTESQRKRYLMPAIRKDGFSDSTIYNVLMERGLKILKLIEESDA